jgi:hypothetical protein
MTKYKVSVIDQTVHRWGEDGEGEHVCNKGGFTLNTYPTLEAAKQGINEFFGYTIEPENYQEEYITGNIIEDVDANANPDGGYIVDYVMCIDKIDRVSFEEAA